MADTTTVDYYEHIILEYVCPSLGCIVAAAMCAAPIQDLRHALTIGSLGNLNPLPWVFMTGNCLGWCAYAYYTNDPFVLASNLPGLILSLWLNQGAIKLQYLELNNNGGRNGRTITRNNESSDDDDDMVVDDDMIIITNGGGDNDSREEPQNNHHPHSQISPETMIFVPQEVRFYRLLLIWSTVLVWVGWISPYLQQQEESQSLAWLTSGSPAEIIGLLTNVNLILFFGAPLTTILEVWKQGQSSSIHRPTMYMNLLCATFWTGYGFARMDPIIIIPNGIGMLLGVAQIIVCAIFPRYKGGGREGRIPLRGESYDDDEDENDDFDDDEDGIVMTKVGTNQNITNGHHVDHQALDDDDDDDDLELL